MTQFEAIEICENGHEDEITYLEAWQFIINSGLAWQLQGFFGRQAMRLYQSGLVSINGKFIEEIE